MTDFIDSVDILSKLPENFYEILQSKKWQERKEALDDFLKLLEDNPALDPKANYNEIASSLKTVLFLCSPS